MTEENTSIHMYLKDALGLRLRTFKANESYSITVTTTVPRYVLSQTGTLLLDAGPNDKDSLISVS